MVPGKEVELSNVAQKHDFWGRTLVDAWLQRSDDIRHF